PSLRQNPITEHTPADRLQTGRDRMRRWPGWNNQENGRGARGKGSPVFASVSAPSDGTIILTTSRLRSPCITSPADEVRQSVAPCRHGVKFGRERKKEVLFLQAPVYANDFGPAVAPPFPVWATRVAWAAHGVLG